MKNRRNLLLVLGIVAALLMLAKAGLADKVQAAPPVRSTCIPPVCHHFASATHGYISPANHVLAVIHPLLLLSPQPWLTQNMRLYSVSVQHQMKHFFTVLDHH